MRPQRTRPQMRAVTRAARHDPRPAILTAALFAVAAFLIALALAGIVPAHAAGQPVYTAGGAAIGGYDPVAYFKQARPVMGSPEHTFAWQGATWRFASAGNRDAFAASPAKYAPQYGGFCAWAVSQGYTAKTDPAAWTIEGGRLYLNYSTSVKTQWSKDIPGNVARADANWPGIAAKLAAE